VEGSAEVIANHLGLKPGCLATALDRTTPVKGGGQAPEGCATT